MRKKILIALMGIIAGLTVFVGSPAKASVALPWYFRWTSNEAYCVTNPGDSTVNGTYVDMEPCHSYTLGGQWYLGAVSGTSGEEIVNWNVTMCLTINPSVSNSRIWVQSCTNDSQCQPTVCQLWNYGYNSSNYEMWVSWPACSGCVALSLDHSNLNNHVIEENTVWDAGNHDQEWCLTGYNINDQVVACRI